VREPLARARHEGTASVRKGAGDTTGPAGRAVGLMGGTFDPIHIGHLVTAEVAWQHFQLDRVVFVPSGSPPHKANRAVSDAQHRYLMTVLATVDNPHFSASRVEVDRGGESFTVDTVREFRRYLGEEARLYFITGLDAVLDILSWKDPRELLNLSSFIAATRPGFSTDGLRALGTALGGGALERVHQLEVPALAISSSDIRRRVARGEPIRYLVPRAVENYIYKNDLYSGAEGIGTQGAGW